MRKIFFLFPAIFAFSQPQLPSIISGETSFLHSPELLLIVASNKAIIEWKEFNIEPTETTRFIQPDSRSSVLNRVLDAAPSRLMGRLESNGQVLLINPNGILVGKEAIIDTGSFIASSLDICDSAFLAKEELCFEGNSKESVQNLGSIHAIDGDVLLIGWNVDNLGSLKAKDGIAGAIAAGHVVIHPKGTDRIFIKPKSVDHLDENIYAAAFKHEDFSQLKAGGSIVSKQSDGKGGDVLLMGDFIEASQLDIDVSGPYRGGTVFVGGGVQGADPRFSNATHVSLDSNVTIHADGTDLGSGGLVVVWSDDHTHFHGLISAKGGPREGDGGFVEVSGKGYLDYTGLANLMAPFGNTGTLLLDPPDVSITEAVANANVTQVGVCPGGITYHGNAGTACITYPVNAVPNIGGAIISAAVLSVNLGACNVIIDTTTPVVGACTGDILLKSTAGFPATAAVTWGTANNLTLMARRNITILDNIQCTGAGNITLTTTVAGIIQINHTRNGRHVSVGTQGGMTQICAPLADVNIEGGASGANGGSGAQVGFFTAGGENCTGPITVTCNNLTIRPPSHNPCQAGSQIGHGNMNNVTQIITTSNAATINVFAHGNITLTTQSDAGGFGTGTGAASNAHSQIGHGCGANSLGTTFSGNINVAAGGNINLICFPLGVAASFVSTIIGHSEGNSTVASRYVVNANSNIQAVGNITVNYQPNSGGASNISALGSYSAGQITAITNNIAVIAGGAITINGSDANQTRNQSYIGWSSLLGNSTVNGTILVSAGGNLIINPRNSIFVPGVNTTNPCCGIGYFSDSNTVGFVAPPSINGDIGVASGGTLTMQILTSGGAAGNGRALIGNPLVPSSAAPMGVSNTFVTAVTGISISGQHNLGIRGSGDVNVSSAGNILLTATGASAADFVFIGTDDTANTGNPRSTRVFSATNIIATNSATTQAFIGRGFRISSDNPNTNAAFPFTTSLDVRAGNDINIAAPFTRNTTNAAQTTFVTVPTSGLIFLEGDTILPVGGLWTSNGNAITSISQVAGTAQTPPAASGINIPLSFSANDCQPVAIAGAIGGMLAASSPQVIFNIDGGVQFDTGAFGGPVILNTSTAGVGAGSITIHSAPKGQVTQNLTVGPGANNVNLFTTNGNIEIWGSDHEVTTTLNCAPKPRDDSYYDITINQAITTTGTVFISAEHNITMTATSSITAAAVTLIVDNQAPVSPFIGTDFRGTSAGSFSMAAGSFINTGAGPLSIYTALQNLNTISGTLNGANFKAGPLFTDSNTEIWCTYFCTPIFTGHNFRVSYKNCLGAATNEGAIIQAEILFRLLPEHPGWAERFLVYWHDRNGNLEDNEPFWLRRRHFQILNHPKSWTAIAY